MNVSPKFPKNVLRISAPALLILLLAAASATMAAQYLASLPRSLAGTWRITRILPTTNTACWTRQRSFCAIGSQAFRKLIREPQTPNS